MNEKNFLCTKQLAKRWDLAHGTLQNWRCAGIGPAYFKIRGRVFYTQSAIEAFENNHHFSTHEQSQCNHLRSACSHQPQEI